MLHISYFEFIVRIIPESFMVILGSYIFVQEKLNKKRYIAASLVLSAAIYIIRSFPITFGVHTLIIMIIYIFIISSINHVPASKTIFYSFAVVITLSVCELINVTFIERVLELDVEKIFENPVTKTLYGLPSLFLFSLLILFLYRYVKREGRKYVFHRRFIK